LIYNQKEEGWGMGRVGDREMRRLGNKEMRRLGDREMGDERWGDILL